MSTTHMLAFFIAFSLTTSFLTSCSDTNAAVVAAEYSLPAGLKDCKVYSLDTKKTGSTLTVVRCPNSQTTTSYRTGELTQAVTILE